MNILIGTILIGSAAIWLFLHLPNAEWRRAARRATLHTLKFTSPRIVVALLGAGFFAALLPEEEVRRFFGPDAGIAGLAVAIALGPVTPGGAFVCFAIAAAALKVGAAPAAMIGYVTSWSIYSLTKIFAYEVSIIGAHPTLVRVIVSLPIPILVTAAAAAFH